MVCQQWDAGLRVLESNQYNRQLPVQRTHEGPTANQDGGHVTAPNQRGHNPPAIGYGVRESLYLLGEAIVTK